jgi:glycosyltransferase involved in cell wall biosynthesis
MQKFRVVGDPKNQPRFSSQIIIDNINQAARRLDLYDEQGKTVVYDCIANHHGYKPDALIVCYELSFPDIITQQCGKIPVIAVSRDNYRFALEGGLDPALVSWTPLGVDTTQFFPEPKTNLRDFFVIGTYSESLVRGGYDVLMHAFGQLFGGNKDVLLYIKDRNGTPEFERWINEQIQYYDIKCIYNNCHLDSAQAERALLSCFDAHCYLNFSSTWAMPPCQTMAMGIPTIATSYSGPREYILDEITGLTCDYRIEHLNSRILSDLQQIGARNFFFTQGYRTPPYWAVPRIEAVMENMASLYKHPEERARLSYNGACFAKDLTWERCAANISCILSKHYG